MPGKRTGGPVAEMVLDLKAFCPRPTKAIDLFGTRYWIMPFVDLPVSEALEVLRIEEDLKGQGMAGMIERSRRQVEMFLREYDQATGEYRQVPVEVLDRLSQRELVGIAEHALGVAGFPLMGSADGSGSDSSSPALPDSTAGPGGTSEPSPSGS